VDLYFAGTEQKMWRTRLDELGVEHVSLSWIGMRRRGQRQLSTPLDELYPPNQKIYLDSGAYTLNKEDAETTKAEAEDLGRQYYTYVLANLDRIEFASEFDAMVLGRDGISALWDWAEVPGDKLMPIWHSEWGIQHLNDMAGEFSRVGILQDDTAGDITQQLRRVGRDTMLHGVAMTRMEAMRAIPWTSVGSTSWLSPTQFGDTFVWTGRELKRYPKRMKDQARKRHRTWLTRQGFDIDKIDADDNAELLRLSVWSWQNYAASLNKGRAVTQPAIPDPNPDVRDAAREAVAQMLGVDEDPAVTTDVFDPFGQNAERDTATVAIDPPETENGELTLPPGKQLLPVLGFSYQEQTDADGSKHSVPVMETPSSGLLQCDSCYMATKCPAMQPHQDCVYEIPVKVRTAAQLAALHDSLIEMQTQRVLLMRMIEQTEGGYVDANLSNEIDRLNKMIKTKQDAGKEGFSINIANVQTPGQVGMIGRVFGRETADKMGALPAGEQDSQDWVPAELVDEE
jgi:hypothetical protein